MPDAPQGRPRERALFIAATLLVAAAATTASCAAPGERTPPRPLHEALVEPAAPYVVVLGTAQDGGLPQIGCGRACCAAARRDPTLRRLVTSLLAVDPGAKTRYLLDASPHLPEQVERAEPFGVTPATIGRPALFDGIYVTHAHLGHYAGLAYLGREAYGTAETTLHGTPRLLEYLRTNGPWSLLFEAGHLRGEPLPEQDAGPEALQRARPRGAAARGSLGIRAFQVPHRGEFSDTVGFVVEGPSRSLLYIPDIDKWERWEVPIEDWIRAVDYALLDGTFFGPGELPGRKMSDIPHPFIVESMERFRALPASERAKIHFTHLNHSNPAADPRSPEADAVRRAGFTILEEGHVFPL
ncbi:MAG: MBL fold metallo-hydrolase [Planctomycetota bacterium]|nr:MBL fold metallo-hydrolase [Planctomycetota bacterium]